MTHRGPTTRTVADAALALDVMAVPRAGRPVQRARHTPARSSTRSIAACRACASRGRRTSVTRPVDPEVRAICEAARSASPTSAATSRRRARASAAQRRRHVHRASPAPCDAAWIGELTDEQRALIGRAGEVLPRVRQEADGHRTSCARTQRRWQLWRTMRDVPRDVRPAAHARRCPCTAFPIGKPPATIGGQADPADGLDGRSRSRSTSPARPRRRCHAASTRRACPSACTSSAAPTRTRSSCAPPAPSSSYSPGRQEAEA